MSNCGYPEGVEHLHVERCYQGGRRDALAEVEAASVDKSRFIEAGFITTCREELSGGERCDQPAEFVLWGKLLPPEALGPRCYGHAADHTHWTMPSRPSQWAVIDLRPIRSMVAPTKDAQ